MTEAQIFILSDNALCNVVDQIKDDQWTMKLPEWFALGGTQDRATLDLKTIINYHAFDDAWVPDVLGGKTAEEVGDKYAGDLLGTDPKAAFRQIADNAVAAAEVADLDAIVHLSYGDYPAKEYFKHITSFRTFRAVDIAKLIGISTQLPEDLVQGVWDEIEPEIDWWRQAGVFGAPVEVPDNAPLQDRLLGMVGRDPR